MVRVAAVELNPVELRILRHYFRDGQGGSLLRDPDAAIRQRVQSMQGGSSLWPDGPAYETTPEGVTLRRGIGGPQLATLRWSRVRAWVDAVPANLRATAVAADRVVNKRHAAITNHGNSADPTVLAWQEARHVRDAALARCFGHQAKSAPALFDPEMPLTR